MTALPDGIAPNFTHVQQKIIERLSGHSTGLAQMYMGGIRVLSDATNPDRIAQSAHSIRESTYHLSHRGKGLLTPEGTEEAKRQATSNARQLERYFDPAGGAPGLQDTAYDIWNDEFHQYFVEVSHHRRLDTLEEYQQRLAAFEEFLIRYILPLQVEIYDRIDECLQEGPERATPRTMQLLLSRNRESYAYFFRKATPVWFSFLRDHRLTVVSPTTKEFLCLSAAQVPHDVSAILTAADLPADDWPGRQTALEVAGTLPSEQSRPLLNRIRQEHWFEDPSRHMVWYAAQEWLQKLISAGGYQEAVELAQQLLAFKKAADSLDVTPLLEAYATAEILKSLETIPAKELRRTIRCLAQLLGNALKAEHPESTGQDSSWIWCQRVDAPPSHYEAQNYKSQLVTAIRDLSAKYLGTLDDGAVENALLRLVQYEPPFLVFVRLRLHLLRAFARHCPSAIADAVVQNFDQTKAWYEYALLLKAVYPTLPPAVHAQYHGLVQSALTATDDTAYARGWARRRLAVIKDHLTQAQQADYDRLGGQEPEVEEPTPLVEEGTWVGPTTSHTPAELNGLAVGDLITMLRGWTPPEAMFGPSREGLGRSLSVAVGVEPARYAADFAQFIDLPPVYLYHLFLGLREQAAKRSIVWDGILSVGCQLVTRAEQQVLQEQERAKENDWEPHWDAVFQELATLLEAGMRNSAPIPFGERERVWHIVAFVANHPEPTPEHEQAFGGENLDPLNLSINTARGHGFHALFAYVEWARRHGEIGIPADAKQVLEAHLDVTREPSLTIRSVYGMHVPYLFEVDEPWTNTELPRIFPQDDRERWYGAWETYLQEPVMPKLFLRLRAEYEYAIRDLIKALPRRRFHTDPHQRLAAHLLRGYVYELPNGQELLAAYYRTANETQRTWATGLAGRSYCKIQTGHPTVHLLQALWTERLQKGSTVELLEFGWWIHPDIFDHAWLLKMLNDTLVKTEGRIDNERHVLEHLKQLSAAFPAPVATALERMVTTRGVNYLLVGTNETLEDTVRALKGVEDVTVQQNIQRIIDHLTKLGLEHYRNL